MGDTENLDGPLRADLVIRASRPDDAEGITELSNLPGFRHGTMRLPFQRISDTRRWLENQKATDVNLVAILDDQLVGSASLSLLAGRRKHTGVIGMGVHDDHLRKGIASSLLGALLDVGDNWLELRRVELTVYTDNAPAIALYEKHGFEHEGLLRSFAFRNGSYVDALTMARLLKTPAV